MASSIGNLKIMRFAVVVIIVGASFFSGLATGSYIYSKISNQPKLPANETAATAPQNNLGQPVAAEGLAQQGIASAISADSLTISFTSPDPAKAKEMMTKTVALSSETVFTERVRLSSQEIDALVKQGSSESAKSGVPFVPPKAYTENAGKLSDIKPGTEVSVILSSDVITNAQPVALQIYYYSGL